MSDSTESGKTICCVGELLWDALPEGLFLGGAPLNVCSHLFALGEQVRMISRVGNDRLGREALRSLQNKGIATECIQTDETVETGFVEVNTEQKEGPAYKIIEPAAWDFITVDEKVQQITSKVDIAVFGTLAQRNEVSRKTIQRVAKNAQLSICDINLRPPYDDPAIVEASLNEADIAKMNEEELMRLADWFRWPHDLKKAGEQLSGSFSCRQVCITCGRDGALLYNEGSWTRQEGIEVEVEDTIGSGDAFLAAFIFGLNHFDSDRKRLQFASLLGALVATKQGAIPFYSFKDIRSFAKRKGVHLSGIPEHGGYRQEDSRRWN